MGLGKSAMGQLGRYRMRRPARIAVVRPREHAHPVSHAEPCDTG